jgi:hypothetical protein
LQIESVPLSLSQKKKKCQTLEIQNGLKNGDFKHIFPVQLGKNKCYKEKEKEKFPDFDLLTSKIQIVLVRKSFLNSQFKKQIC